MRCIVLPSVLHLHTPSRFYLHQLYCDGLLCDHYCLLHGGMPTPGVVRCSTCSRSSAAMAAGGLSGPRGALPSCSVQAAGRLVIVLPTSATTAVQCCCSCDINAHRLPRRRPAGSQLSHRAFRAAGYHFFIVGLHTKPPCSLPQPVVYTLVWIAWSSGCLIVLLQHHHRPLVGPACPLVQPHPVTGEALLHHTPGLLPHDPVRQEHHPNEILAIDDVCWATVCCCRF